MCPTLVIYFFICFDPKVLQRFYIYIFSILKRLCLFCSDIVPFPYTFIFMSLTTCYSLFNIVSAFKLSDNVSRNFNWSGSLYIIPVVVGFMIARRSLIKMFSILFERHLCLLKQMLFLT